MRLAVVALVLSIAATVLPAAALGGLIDLKIRFQADAAATPRTLTLRCADRSTGTVARAAEACRRLQRLGDDVFRPTPPQTACTAISGGPSLARVTGIYFGRPVWVTLRRENGCEIARWQRVAFLLPAPAPPA